ncbi:helix-turn-helix domain-containing protein [Mucilaginibacter pocheonensis]|uniref:Transcriptional regulator with XRE-family HTH domain n=1 Tax=Mucilaginibacter pocheonensis TaxID=398050 RepID=A0ABU1T7G8_9SPHI|nr:helix-turn-helix transcriptional regulator [Mucilaginibacter pocheonensis]MDR6941347.1 transcriptional regulator with XRE-family HTH domain [Mucilaginibacter pocheonensis]
MATDNKTLGGLLKEARELRRLSLREVETQSGISNAYLSQLENDKIKKPSANTLYKLSGLFKIDFDDLMVTAGIVEKKETSTAKNDFAFSSENLTDYEREELIKYLKYLRHQQKDDKP